MLGECGSNIVGASMSKQCTAALNHRYITKPFASEVSDHNTQTMDVQVPKGGLSLYCQCYLRGRCRGCREEVVMACHA